MKVVIYVGGPQTIGFMLPVEVGRACVAAGIPAYADHFTGWSADRAGIIFYAEPVDDTCDVSNTHDRALRCHPALVAAVEALSPERRAAFGLKVVTIPFDTADGWEILRAEDETEEIRPTDQVWR
jgi:hypothetical protein